MASSAATTTDTPKAATASWLPLIIICLAGDTASDHLLRACDLWFTIIFASVLFFAGVSGKFRCQPIDFTVLLVGSVALIVGLFIRFASPLL
jgi:hypothetical protein